ncbi:uncharacterized protein N7483_010575 [Penicillium malachiteum]|uniref:uncharacterized protein n=1 Tax=Penicillium malachiteum TaxID=1324776 RepID=UPI00254929D5|nr:uncharacterized protein N7483_010575 [Penicillium malachiteum]KAJ5713394.1 hypothetical protein N7483_010575 [Penicillium malachiteum]
MENHPPVSSAISGDLPIRPARRTHQEDGLETQDPVKKVQIEDVKDEPSDRKPQLGMTTTKFEEEVSEAVGPVIAAQLQKKKKHNKRPKSKRGLGRPTGFEEWGADGPLTPEEHAEDIALYDRLRPFINRMEEALMRFDRKRRIESFRRNIFHKYLQYGGITIGPNFGTGVPAKELKTMTKLEAMQARAQTMIEKERERLDISFDKVVRGFLGSFFMRYFNPEDEEAIKFATNTISNFYTYLLFHDVCPEYTEDLLQARETCQIAGKELFKNLKLVGKGAGLFNKSCSMLFGGCYFEHAEDQKWKQEPFHEGAASHKAASLFLALVTAKDALTAEKVNDIDGFEVISVSEPEPTCRGFYQRFAPDLTPVGMIKAKSFRDPNKPHIDLSPKEQWDWEHGRAPSYEFEFLVEIDVLSLMYPGLKVLTDVWELNCGIFYFDEIYSVYPTFYTVIANDMMLNWKRPHAVTAEDAEETQASKSGMDAGMKDAVKKALKATGHKVDGNQLNEAEENEDDDIDI